MGDFSNFTTFLTNDDEDSRSLISNDVIRGSEGRFDFPDFTSSSSVLLNNNETELLSLLGGNESGTTQVPTSLNGTVATLERDEFLAKIEQLVLILIFVFTLAGNFLVLMGIYFRKEKMSRMYYFILHLAIADLTTAFFNVLTQLFWEMTHRFQGGAFMCKFVKYTQILGPYSSSYILVMTALDRYQAICYPLTNCSWTARRSKLMLGIAWTLAIVFCLPQVYIFTYQEIPHGGDQKVYDCWATFAPDWGEKAYITWYCITIFIIPLIILVFAYTCITRAIWINFNMKNAAMKEEKGAGGGGTRPGRRFTRGDSDEFDESVVVTASRRTPPTTYEGNIGDDMDSSAVFQERDSKWIPNSANLKSFTKSKSLKAKNLEVSWHQRKQQTRASLSAKGGGGDDDELTGANNSKRCHSYSSASSTLNGDVVVGEEGHQCFPDSHEDLMGHSHKSTSKNNDNVSTHIISHRGGVSSANDSTTTTINKQVDGGKKSSVRSLSSSSAASDNKSRWNSMSTKSNRVNLRAHFGNGSPKKDDLGNENMGMNGKDRSKSTFLAPLSNGNPSAGQFSKKSLRLRVSSKSSSASQSQPRTHSVKGISRAKIKTIKLTVTVICCYIICSTPFIAALLWSAYDPYAKTHPFWFGPTFTILTLLASLNSCVNSWIVLFFNPNLLQSFFHGICPRFLRNRSRPKPNFSMNASQRKLLGNQTKLMGANSHQMGATSMSGLSPVMNRFSPNKDDVNRSKNGRSSLELLQQSQPLAKSHPNRRPSSQFPQSHSLLESNNTNNSPNRNGKKERESLIPIETSFIGI